MKNDSYVTFDVDGKNKKFKVIASFEYDEKTYLIYSDLKEKSGVLKTYAGIYDEKSKKVSLITKPSDLELVQSFLSKIE